ncbi:hypothetical protein OG799_26430 [Micromonospora sp. NBC_00898]|uniref:hypothetical protein n=1 Tax=Micromonospora sp. NBC_00898 TaxID=2975981 RepID=UPI0038654FA4|nr:hypothetical protein OG799_26430 [Micromonospora sp. NBC_00898]
MGVLYDYFAAASDEQAAATIDLEGGPGGALPSSPELQAAIRAGDREAMKRLMLPSVRISEHGLPVLSVKGIDPVVQLGTLEGLLTGVSTEVIFARPRSGMAVAVRDEGERLVLSLTAELQQVLADQAPERLAAVAGPWSQTEEFWGHGDATVLAHFLREFSLLARDAGGRNHRLYCWVCV